MVTCLSYNSSGWMPYPHWQPFWNVRRQGTWCQKRWYPQSKWCCAWLATHIDIRCKREAQKVAVEAEPLFEIHGWWKKEFSICSSHAVWGRVLLNRLPPQWTSLRPLGNVKLFWLPTLKLPSRLQGWIQADFYTMQIVLYKCCYLL